MNNETERQTINFFAMGFRELTGSMQDKEGNAGKAIAALFFFIMGFLFSGAEAFKVLLRRNFARGTVGIYQIIIAALAFIGWSFLCLFPDNIDILSLSEFADKPILNITGIFYGILGIVVLILGVIEWNKSYNNANSTTLGESAVLAMLRKEGWSEYKIKQIAEPLLVLSVSILFLGINLFLGIPLLFCGISLVVFNLFSYKEKVENTPLNTVDAKKRRDDQENYVR